MGYGSYEIVGGPLSGEPGGYGIEAACGFDGCGTVIDRGTAYLCGDNPHGGEEDSCGLWFCDEHLHYCENGRRCEDCCIDDEGDLNECA